jgi:parallel beta-helix repeat protein
MKNALALIIVIALLLSSIANMGLMKNAAANPALKPEEPPPGYTINADGRYYGENIRREGNTYTLTGNINCPIVIEKDNIVLDGAGYNVEGNGVHAGVWLQDKSGITIKNLNIKNFRFGIEFSPVYGSNKNTANCSIIANRLTDNTYGMYISASSGCYIADNYIAENTNGAKLEESHNIFKNNRFVRNQYNILDQGWGDNDLDTSNTVDGKPIYYWVNKHDMAVPSNAGMVFLKNCTKINVENLSLKHNGNGILLVNTNNCTINDNELSDNLKGLALEGSYSNTISGNHIKNNPNGGIEITWSSHNNQIFNNAILGNGGDGLACSDSENDIISNNQIIANQGTGISAGANCNITNNYVSSNLGHGIFIRNISGCNLLGNNITLNGGNGIHFEFGPNAMIKGNYIAENNIGIWIGAAFFNNIISNTIIENNGLGIKMEGPHHDNLIYHNNFINNNQSGIQASIAKHWVYPELFKRLPPHVTPRPPQYVDGAANAWDDGTEGNYWSNYQSADNSPYYINENNQDNHPLQSPHTISSFETPTKMVGFPSSPTQQSIEQPQEPIKTSSIFLDLENVAIIIILVILAVPAIVLVAALYFKRRRDERQRKEL